MACFFALYFLLFVCFLEDLAGFGLAVSGGKLGIEEYLSILSQSVYMPDTWSHSGHRLSLRL